MMKCCHCGNEMEVGQLDLKAWGSGLSPQAQLHFNGELLLKNQYLPIVGFVTEGTKVSACRCKDCGMITFSYR